MAIVEICSNSRQSAVNAKNGGASRIELCQQLEIGGTTPSAADIAFCVSELKIRTHVLVRPRGGDFTYSEQEFAQICDEVEQCRRAGAHAVVVGFLTPDGRIDEQRTRHIVQLARPMEVTFHRAFDEIRQSPSDALEAVIRTGCTRILTSGCSPSAEEGIAVLRRLVEQAGNRITILCGAGVTPGNAARILRETGAREIHGSCKATLPDGTIQTSSDIVKQLIASL